jgi:hypothetical protein
MKTLYAALIGMVTLLMVVPLEAGAPKSAFPSWGTQINTPKRFIVLATFGGAAVQDKETGLVWEQSPETAPNPTTTQDWLNAQASCVIRTVGGRKGWRLPTIQELASLIDPNNPGGNPDLPPGHPFSNVQSSVYWSATTTAFDTANAWVVNLGNGDVAIGAKAFPLHVWCVRAGQGVDPQ